MRRRIRTAARLDRREPRDAKHYLKDGQARCDIGIRPPGWVKKAAESDGFLRDYAIEILVADAPFDALARISFLETDEGWRTESRGLDTPAEELKTRCCRGLRGSGWSRVWNKEGEVGSESYEVAVLNDRKQHSAYFYVQLGDSMQRICEASSRPFDSFAEWAMIMANAEQSQNGR